MPERADSRRNIDWLGAEFVLRNAPRPPPLRSSLQFAPLFKRTKPVDDEILLAAICAAIAY